MKIQYILNENTIYFEMKIQYIFRRNKSIFPPNSRNLLETDGDLHLDGVTRLFKTLTDEQLAAVLSVRFAEKEAKTFNLEYYDKIFTASQTEKTVMTKLTSLADTPEKKVFIISFNIAIKT
jgi:hypothetical protein